MRSTNLLTYLRIYSDKVFTEEPATDNAIWASVLGWQRGTTAVLLLLLHIVIAVVNTDGFQRSVKVV